MSAETNPPIPPSVQTPELASQTGIDWVQYLDIAEKSAVVLAVMAFLLSLFAFLRSRQNDRASVFMALRGEYAVILEKLQTDVPDHNENNPLRAYNSLSRRARKILRAYWIHSLNEFVITNVVHRKDSLGLWKPFFSRAQSFALDMPFFKAALEELIVSENFSFGGQKDAYLTALEKAYKIHRGKTIRILRNRCDKHHIATNTQKFDSAATLSAQIIKDLKARLKKADLPEDLRPFIIEAERLLKTDDSTAFQNQGLTACLALEAAANGDFGVGAVLIDPADRVLAMAKNTVFTSQNTSCHAEMNIISGLQLDGKALSTDSENLTDLTLISSLEPCPMCLSRISMSPIRTTIYLSPDPEGGMVAQKEHMPKVWKTFLSDKSFKKSDYKALEKLAKNIFDYTESQNAKLGA